MVQAKVAGFGFAGNGAVVDALLANELAAAESDVEDGVEAAPGAEEGFGKAGSWRRSPVVSRLCYQHQSQRAAIRSATKTHSTNSLQNPTV